MRGPLTPDRAWNLGARSAMELKRHTVSSLVERSVALDAQVLIDALEEPTVLRRLLQWVDDAADYLVVPVAVLHEVVPPDGAVGRIRALAVFARALGARLRVLDHWRVIEEELRVNEHGAFRDSRLHRPRSLVSHFGYYDFSRLASNADSAPTELSRVWAKQMSELSEVARDRKRSLFASDRSLARIAEEWVPPQGRDPTAIIALLRSGRAVEAGFWLLEAVAETSNGVWSPRELLARPHRFAATTMWTELAQRQMFANVVDLSTLADNRSVDTVRMWKTPRRGRGGEGEWYDNLIAASAAYTDVLFTLDKRLKTKCEFLRRAGLCRFRIRDSW